MTRIEEICKTLDLVGGTAQLVIDNGTFYKKDGVKQHTLELLRAARESTDSEKQDQLYDEFCRFVKDNMPEDLTALAQSIGASPGHLS